MTSPTTPLHSSAEAFALEFEKQERLFELAAALGRQNEFDEILRVVTQQAASLLSAETALLFMLNPQTQQTMKTIFRQGEHGKHESRYHAIHLEISGWVMKNKRALFSANIKDDSRFGKKRYQDLPLKSVMCAALCNEGMTIGSLLLLNHARDGEFNARDLAYLEKFAAVVAPFLRNAQKLREYFSAPLPEATLLVKYEALGLLGRSKKFVALLQALEAAARCDVRVLLEGQTGTGKELTARAIHRLSSRSERPFTALDCGAIPAALLESELFGHVKGAFTGATSDRKGLLEEAHLGTLFMDEVANLPLDMQAKLLRVLQEGEIRPLGSNKTRAVDVRIIAACSTPLRQMVEGKKFREDLFYRLHVYPINVPSLNERGEDIPLLAQAFLDKFAREQRKAAHSFHAALLQLMQQRRWAGNIRELENFVERLVTLAPAEAITLEPHMLPPEFQKELKKLAPSLEALPSNKGLQQSLEDYEERLLRQALDENEWNQRKAARALQISEGTLRYKLEKLGIVRGAEGLGQRT